MATERPLGLVPSSDSMAEDRMANLMQKGNPFMSATRNRSQEYFGGRGLVDSTIAAGAGERAAIESAMPMVLQDSKTHANAELTGYEANLQNWLQGSESQRTLERDKIQQSYMMAGKSADVANELSILSAAHGYDQQTAEQKHRDDLSFFSTTAGITLENQKNLLTFNQAIDKAAEDRKWDTISKSWVQDSIMTIETTPNMTAEDKTTMINRIIALADYMSSAFDFSGIEIV